MSSSKQQEERERVRTLIEDSQSLPEALRHALLNRLNEEQETAKPPPSSTTSSLGVSRVLSSLKKAPAEVLDKVSQKVEEIREERVEQVKLEVKKLLESIDLQKEVVKVLSQVSIDLKTTIRLVPDPNSTVGVKPQVKTQAKLNWSEKHKSTHPVDDEDDVIS